MTYSIVARDSRTGELGVAVQSHYFSVGSVVTWAQAGVGAVATQSFVQPSYGPLGLELMKAGIDAAAALDGLAHADPERDRRQVAMIDAQGAAAAHTGTKCIQAAGHLVGDAVSVQANMMRNDRVWPAMLDAYHNAAGELADRLLAALDAGEAAGGDLRGRQSAAMLVVSGVSTNQPWRDRVVDLRVEDSTDPLAEMRRLLTLRRGYRHIEWAEEREIGGDIDGALSAYRSAQDALGAESEATFWVAVMLVQNGRPEEARGLLARMVAEDAGWGELLRRLPDAGLLDADRQTIEGLLTGAEPPA